MGGARELLCAYARALIIAQTFHYAKKFAEKIFTNGMHWQKFSPDESLHVYGITLYCSTIHRAYPS